MTIITSKSDGIDVISAADMNAILAKIQSGTDSDVNFGRPGTFASAMYPTGFTATRINNALSALPSTGGCVFVPPGVYTLATSLAMRSNQMLVGTGMSARLTLSANANVDAIYIPANATNVYIGNLLIDGNRANQTPGGQIHGIDISASVHALTIERCRITNVYDNGISFTGGSFCTLSNNSILNAGRSGIYLTGSYQSIIGNRIERAGSRVAGPGILTAGLTDSVIVRNFITRPTDDCISLTTSSRNVMSKNWLIAATLNGVETDTTSTSNLIVGNVAKSNVANGLQITAKNVIQGNLVMLNGRNGIKVTAILLWKGAMVIANYCADNGTGLIEQSGIACTGAGPLNDSIINDNICTDTGSGTQLTGITLNNADYIIVSDNDLRGNVTNALTFAAGTNNRIVRNLGYNPVGMATFTINGSPFTYTNNDNVQEYVTIYGGTASSFVRNGFTVGTISPFSAWLEPGEKIRVVYSLTPNGVKDRK